MERARPEIAVGGFPRDHGGLAFYARIDALLSNEMTLVDLGAGRGEQFEYLPEYVSQFAKFQGKTKRVIGLDVDTAIENHPHLDERHVIQPNAEWPVASRSVDIVVADWVLEHVEYPARVAAELERVLKPGGWFCARTPNRWGYVGIGARLVPNSLHKRLLKWVWPNRKDIDVFPTFYRLNSLGDVRRYFRANTWLNCSYVSAVTPRYHSNSRFLFGLIDMYQRLMPQPLKTDLLIFLQKKV